LAIQIVLALSQMLAVLRHTGITWRVDRNEVRESLRFGSKSYAMSLAGHIHQRVDIFMIAYMLADPAQVAFYAISLGLVRQLRLVPESIAVAALPELSGLAPSAAASFVCKLSRQATAGIVPVLLAAAVGGGLAIGPIYGAPYQASVLPFLVLLVSFPALTVWATVARFYIATNRQQTTIGVQAVGLATNIVLNLLLIPKLGILGAAIGSLTAHLLEGSLLTAVFIRHTGHSLADLFLFSRADIEPYRRRLRKLLAR
jgi:O-antigen/teichoic acid export membrane protein